MVRERWAASVVEIEWRAALLRVAERELAEAEVAEARRKHQEKVVELLMKIRVVFERKLIEIGVKTGGETDNG